MNLECIYRKSEGMSLFKDGMSIEIGKIRPELLPRTEVQLLYALTQYCPEIVYFIQENDIRMREIISAIKYSEKKKGN